MEYDIQSSVVPLPIPTQVELANLNHCAVPFLNRAAVNLSCFDSTNKTVHNIS